MSPTGVRTSETSPPMPATMPLTLIRSDGATTIQAAVTDGRVLVDPETIAATIGWHRRPEGLCRGEVCVPVRDDAGVDGPEGSIDLTSVAEVLRRPFVLDAEAGAAYLGEAAHDRAAMLRTQIAPDFTLPDLAGRSHTLSEHRGKKVFFVAWASW
jgi:hypothetical protein